MTGVVVPEKYIWCRVPGTPPSMNSDADARLATVAPRLDTRPMVAQMNARAVVEHFEEAFNPKVNHPPAPVLHDGNVRAFNVEQAGAVEQTASDGGRRRQSQPRTEEPPVGKERV